MFSMASLFKEAPLASTHSNVCRPIRRQCSQYLSTVKLAQWVEHSGDCSAHTMMVRVRIRVLAKMRMCGSADVTSGKMRLCGGPLTWQC